MMTHRRLIVTMGVLALATLLTACAPETPAVLKSPCVGLEGSPCGPKRPVNGTLNPAAHEHS